MTEESTQNKKRRLDAGVPAYEDQFGPDQIAEMNQHLPDETITLYLPPDFDKKLLPVKARGLRNWWEADEKTRMHARFCLPLTMASGLGYYILSPATFTIEWDGEPTHDTELTITDAASHASIDNHSSFGSFTVQARFIVRTKNIGDFIYIKGVANQTRQPFHVMEAMIESWWSPSEFGIVCLVNQPGKFTIKKGEPLAQMFVINTKQAQYGLGVTDGYPPIWEAWTARRDPAIYDGRNMDYLRGVLPDQTPVCPHMKSWTEAQVNEVAAEKTIEHSWVAGDTARVSNDYDEAVRHYLVALQLAEEKREVTEDLLNRLKHVGHQLQHKGVHVQAIRLLRKCVELSERYFPPTGLDFTTELYNDIGWSYRAAGDLENSTEILTETLRRKRAEKVAPMSLARVLIDLGTLQDFRGNREAAMPLMKEANEIYKVHLPEDHVDHLYFKNVYGCLLTHVGKYDEAEPLYQEVIRERSKLFGEDSLEVADTYNDLGFHYKEQKNFAEAEKYFKKCIENRKKQNGADDPLVASSHEDLSWMYREKGDFKNAKQQLEIALDIRKKKLYPHDNILRGTYLALADVYRELGDTSAAEKAMKLAKQN